MLLDNETLYAYSQYDVLDNIWRIISRIPDHTEEEKIYDILKCLIGYDDEYEYNTNILDMYEYDAYQDFYGELAKWLEYKGIKPKELMCTTLYDIIKNVYFKDTTQDEFTIQLEYSDEVSSVWEHQIAPNIFGKYLIKQISNH